MKEFAMRQLLSCVMVGALLLVGYAPASVGVEPRTTTRERPLIPDMVAPNQNVPPGAASPFSTLSPLPSRPPLFQMAPPSVPEGQIGAALNRGPVTGYGPGGLGHVPDSPLNLPY